MRASEHVLNCWAWVAGRPSLRKVNNFLLFLALRGLGVGNVGMLDGEMGMLAKLAPRWRSLGANAVFIDVGANEGEYSSALRSLCPEAKLLAFEPHPATAARLRKRFGSTVEVQALAMGTEAGCATLWDYPQQTGSKHASLFSGVIEGHHHSISSGVEVRVTSLDLFCEENGIDRIDHLKLDVEGAELACLRGGSRLIARECIGTVQFEFNSMNVTSRVFFHDFVDLLPRFHFYRLLPHGLMELPVGDFLRCNFYGIQNILAVSPGVMAEPPHPW